ncbi:MAG TPA: M81 family metallopeptidase [Steroidobacteraceae bacterium]|nr:M81 family metallopeptidase [Steroidobacteraceae bacterium]
MRLFAAGLITETNTFAPWPTGRRGFSAIGPFRGDATTRGRDDETGVLAGVWKELSRRDGHEFVEGFFAHAQPSGPTLQSIYEEYREEILAELQARMPVDVALFFLHGAMVSTGCDDCEGDILGRARAILGPQARIGALLDPHCHLTPRMVESADAIVLIKEYPHVDYPERGAELYEICTRAARGQCRPAMHLFDCRMVGFYPTTIEPMAGLVRRMKEAEKHPAVLSVSFGHGFPWGDTPETGSKVLAIADGDPRLAESVAARIGHAIYDAREALLPRYPSISAALDRARAHQGVVVLADTADNSGGGAPSDNVSLLRAMLAAGVKGAAYAGIWDPVTVGICAEAGIGATLPLRIGGKCGPASGDPMDVVATVKAFVPGHSQQDLGPSRCPMGDSAWLEIGGIDVVLMSVRTQIFSPDAFTGLGIDLGSKRIIALKSSWHFQANFGPVADELIPVATPGALQMDFAAIDYRKKRDQRFFPRVADPLGRG